MRPLSSQPFSLVDPQGSTSAIVPWSKSHSKAAVREADLLLAGVTGHDRVGQALFENGSDMLDEAWYVGDSNLERPRLALNGRELLGGPINRVFCSKSKKTD